MIGSSLGYRNSNHNRWLMFLGDTSFHPQLPELMASNALLSTSFSAWSLSFISVSIQSLVCLVPIVPVLIFTISFPLSLVLSRSLIYQSELVFVMLSILLSLFPACRFHSPHPWSSCFLSSFGQMHYSAFRVR